MIIQYPKYTSEEIAGIIKETSDKEKQIKSSPAYYKETILSVIIKLPVLAAYIFTIASSVFFLPSVYRYFIDKIAGKNLYDLFYLPFMALIFIIISAFLIISTCRIINFLAKIIYRKQKRPLAQETALYRQKFDKIYPYFTLLKSIENIKELPQAQLMESDFYINEDGFTVYLKENGYINKKVFICEKDRVKDICRPDLIDFSSIDEEIDEILGAI